MTTVGYGDIVAVSNTEKLFAVFAMIVGGSTFGYIVGSMASLFGRFNGGDARNKEKMDQVVEYMVRCALCVLVGAGDVPRNSSRLLSESAS